MRKKYRGLASVAIIFAMMISVCMPVFAADSSVTYEGGAEKFVFLSGSDYTDTDLFDGFKGVMPGDTLTEKITVKNSYKGCDYVNVYMRAEKHDENTNPLSEKVDQQEDVASMEDFLSQLTMTVKQGEKVLFKASPDELGGLNDNVLIARLAKGAETELTVELEVPITLDNTYANRVGEVDWVFAVEERNNPGNSDKETENPEEPEVYPYVPMIQAPKTGDNANLILWIAVLAVAATAIVCICKKRKNQ